MWRYPVKSLHGEQVDRADITADGVVGDRIFHVRGDRGLLTGRTRHDLLTLRTGSDEAGNITVDGEPWDSEAAATRIRRAAGEDARLVADNGRGRFDVLPLLVATQAEVDRLGVDRRRLRPNLVIAGAWPGEERTWPGRSLRIGTDVVVAVDSVRLRCVVTTIDPDTARQDLDVLRRIRREFASRTALNCWVVTGGVIRSGDPVTPEMSPADAQECHPGYDSWISGGISYPV